MEFKKKIEAAADLAHKENILHFERQREHIDEIFGSLQSFIEKKAQDLMTAGTSRGPEQGNTNEAV